MKTRKMRKERHYRDQERVLSRVVTRSRNQPRTLPSPSGWLCKQRGNPVMVLFPLGSAMTDDVSAGLPPPLSTLPRGRVPL